LTRVFRLFSIFMVVSGSILSFSGIAAEQTESPADKADTGGIIDSIIIENRQIFDTENPRFDYWIYHLANKFHIRTKASVISREVLQARGEKFSPELARETERNLRTLPYIYDSEVFLDTRGDRNCLVVRTSDRWTLTGGPTFSRVSGQTVYNLSLEELNLFGYGQQVLLNYYIREFENNYLEASFYERRLFGSRQSLFLYSNGHPEVGQKRISLSRPFYELEDKFSWNIAYTFADRQDRYYLSGFEVNRDYLKSKRFNIGGVYRFGEYLSKVSFGLDYQYHDRRLVKRETYYSIPLDPINDSLYQAVVSTFGVGYLKYYKTNRVSHIKKTEDISVNTGATMSFGWYFDASSGDRLYRSLTYTGRYGVYYKSNYFSVVLGKGYWFDGPKDIRKWTQFSLSYFNNGLPFMTPIALLSYTVDNRYYRRVGLSVGEDNGLRGYPREYVTGEKLLRINVENRLFTGMEILSASIGGVLFIDGAQGLFLGENPNLNGMVWSFGGGLRFAAEKVSSADVVRIDLAYAEKLREWQLSFGVGQYF